MEQQPAAEEPEVPKPVDVDTQKVDIDEENEKMEHPGDTVSVILEKGKALTKKGKQVSFFLTENSYNLNY